MPLAFLLVGAVLVVVAVRGTHANLGQLLTQDFVGSGGADHGFLVWLAAIAGIGALGMVPAMRVPARLLLGLVILAILISNQGVFAQAAKTLGAQIPGVSVNTATAAPTDQPLPAAFPVQVTQAGGGSSGSSGDLGDAANIAKTVATIAPMFL